MTEEEIRATYDLEAVMREAVDYVGSANYDVRERWARKEVGRNFHLFRLGRFSEIKFKEDV